MRLAVAPTALLVTVFEGATRLISGISRIPNVLARAVAAAHSEADKKETDHQMRVVAARRDSPLSLPEPISESDDDVTVDRAVGTIEDILKKYRIKGLDAYVVITPDGRILVVVGTPPNSEAELAAALEGARMLLGEPTLKE